MLLVEGNENVLFVLENPFR